MLFDVFAAIVRFNLSLKGSNTVTVDFCGSTVENVANLLIIQTVL